VRGRLGKRRIAALGLVVFGVLLLALGVFAVPRDYTPTYGHDLVKDLLGSGGDLLVIVGVIVVIVGLLLFFLPRDEDRSSIKILHALYPETAES